MERSALLADPSGPDAPNSDSDSDPSHAQGGGAPASDPGEVDTGPLEVPLPGEPSGDAEASVTELPFSPPSQGRRLSMPDQTPAVDGWVGRCTSQVSV